MLSHTGADAAFDASELVAYAKALLTNVEFLRALEARPRVKVGVMLRGVTLPRSRDMMEEVRKAYELGRFARLRYLRPQLSDEAIENRLHRMNRQLERSSNDGSEGHSWRATNTRISGSFVNLLPNLLSMLAETFLREGHDGSLRVRSELLKQWQDLVLVVPPMLITSAWMTPRLFSSESKNHETRSRRSAVERMALWLCDSTLPVDDEPALDYLCRTQGLDEIHMHLNGTTEAEKVWCDALKRPDHVVGALLKRKARDSGIRINIGNGVEHLLRQEDDALTGELLRRRVNDAIALKTALLNKNYEENQGTDPTTCYRKAIHNALPSKKHTRLPKVVHEAWLLCTIFADFTSPNDPSIKRGLMLWHYALLRAQFCRLLVQQVAQVGFDQFQYITLNELREDTEKDFAERFRQIERVQQKGVDYLEGRFAPKITPDRTAALLGQVLRGYLRFLGEEELGEAGTASVSLEYGSLGDLLERVRELELGKKIGRCDHEALKASAVRKNISLSPRRLRLGLVAHFIKMTDVEERQAFYRGGKARSRCRDSIARQQTDQSARALISVIKRTPGLDTLIRGVDAASNERHAGPEVFAPAFRRMRDAGMQRFTYHAGEDFAHIVSGLRAICEAVHFLDLDAGCRIGHATASGLNAETWWRAVDGHVILPLEDRLDDLVFARATLLSNRACTSWLPVIDAEIQSLSMRLWEDPSVSVEHLVDAWQLRRLDPLARKASLRDVEPRLRAEALLHEVSKQSKKTAYELFLRRHGIKTKSDELCRMQEDVVVFRETDVLSLNIIKTLQHCVLKLLHERRIAIETLPSSNVRISIHECYEDHHAQNWLGQETNNALVPVTVSVGSDDPGIFATSLRIEYAHLMRNFRNATSTCNGPDRSEEMITKLCNDSKKYRF